MNYDFSENELAMFADITQKISDLAPIDELEKRDPALNARNIRHAMKILSQTPYLRLGLCPTPEFSGHLTLMGAMEVLAAASPSVYLSIEAGTRLFGRALSQWGGSGQKEQWLSPVLEGEMTGALAISEATLNIENAPLTTQGERQGDAVVINGAKQYVINAPIADWIAVAGVMEGQHALFLIEKAQSGLILGPALQTPGYEGTPISGLTIENARIPAAQVLLADERADMPAAIRMWENQILLGASLGLSKTAFEEARDYAKSHQSGGKPIIAYQEVGFKLAEMLTLLQTSQLLAYRTAWTIEAAPAEAAELMLCAKVFCAESAEQICSAAMQILGGSGYISGNRVERAFRCAKYAQIAGTSTEIARVQIGDAALGYRN